MPTQTLGIAAYEPLSEIDRKQAWSLSPARDRVAAKVHQPPANEPPPLAIAKVEPLSSGPLIPGNIDLKTRPVAVNPDGSISSVRSMSINVDGKEVLIPTVVGGKVVSNDAAIAQYRRTGQHLGIFSDVKSADAYAEQLHEDYAAGAYGDQYNPSNYVNGTFVKPVPVVPIVPDLKGPIPPATPEPPLDPATAAYKHITPGTEQPPMTAAEVIANLHKIPVIGQEVAGAERFAKGLATLGNPERLKKIAAGYAKGGPLPEKDTETQGAISDLIEGTFGILTPILAGSALEAPFRTAFYVGSAVTAQKLAEKAVDLAGGDAETKRLVGNVAALGSGVMAELARFGIFMGAKHAVDARIAADRPAVIEPQPTDIPITPERTQIPEQVEGGAMPTGEVTPPQPVAPEPSVEIAKVEPLEQTPIATPPPIVVDRPQPASSPIEAVTPAPTYVDEPLTPTISRVGDALINAVRSIPGVKHAEEFMDRVANPSWPAAPEPLRAGNEIVPVNTTPPNEMRMKHLLEESEALRVIPKRRPQEEARYRELISEANRRVSGRDPISYAAKNTAAFIRSAINKVLLKEGDGPAPLKLAEKTAVDLLRFRKIEKPAEPLATTPPLEEPPIEPPPAVAEEPLAIAKSEPADEEPVAASAEPDLHVRRELKRIVTELQEMPFTKRGFVDAGRGRGGDLEVVPGAAGAPVYDDVLQASPGTSGYTRAQMAAAIDKYLDTGKLTNPARGAIAVAQARIAGTYRIGSQDISKPKLDIDAFNEPGQIYVDRAKDLSTRQAAVQERAATLVESTPTEMVATYRKKFGTVVNADLAKELFPDYVADPTSTSLAVHRPSQALAQAVYDQIVDEPTPDGKAPVVIFTGGGTGSGKSSALELVAPNHRDFAHVVYDSTLTNALLAVRNIDRAVAAGKSVGIVFVYRPVYDAFEHGVLPRAKEIGRPVTIESHARTHTNALNTMRELVRVYGLQHPQVEFRFVTNRGEKGEVRVVEYPEIAGIRYTQADVEANLRDILQREHDADRVSAAIYAATQKSSLEEIHGGSVTGNQDKFGQGANEASRGRATEEDRLETGEAQPRLPEAGAVRTTEIPTPQFEAPFALSSDVAEQPSTQTDLFRGGGGGGESNVGAFSEGEPARSAPIPKPDDRRLFPGTSSATTSQAQPVQFPELVELAKQLQGTPKVVKAFRAVGKLGEFSERGIKLTAELFKPGNEYQLAATLAHEIGHLVDWLPDQTLKRGNLLGRLRSLQAFLKGTFTSIDGNTIKNKDIRAELLELSDLWRPWDPAKASAGFKQYRHSGRELYADALSVLLNNPGLLQQKAPIFYREFFAALDQKPDVERAYFDLQELLSGTPEELVARRREGVRRMLEEGDVAAVDLEKRRQAEQEARRKDLWLRLKIQLVDKNYAVIDRVRALQRHGVEIADDENPIYLLEERNYIGGKLKAFTERHFAPIFTTLSDADIHWNAFGEALFYERIIAGDRSEVANPRGLSPSTATELYDSLKRELGQEKVRTVDESIATFRAAVRQVANDAYQAGLYTPELYQQMQDNPAYVTFQVVDHLESGVTSRVYRQVGTLKDVVNPADATILKTLVTLRAIEHQQVKKGALEFLATHFPTEVTAAKTVWTGKGHKPIESKDPHERLITYYKAGTLVGKYVDPHIAASLENESIGQNFAIVTMLRRLNSGVFRPLFTTFNVGFQSFNFLRDFNRFWKNIPGMTLRKALVRYWAAVPMAKVRAFGLPETPTPETIKAYRDLLDAEESKLLSVTFNDVNMGRDVQDTQIEDILARSGVGGFQLHRRSPFVKPFVKVLDVLRETGDFIETLPKAAAVYEYKGSGSISGLPASTRSFIRRKVGSPDFLAGGTAKPITNEVFLFSNAIAQALRSDYEVATEPQTRSGFWWKTVAANLLPKVLMAAALIGLFGDTIRRLLSKTTEYDRTNYVVLPLGEDASGNTVYLRIPQDETGRFVGGVFWKALQLMRGDQEVLQTVAQVVDYSAGQFPSVSPSLDTIRATNQFVSGQNPYDQFRGRNVFTDDEWKARDWRTAKKFIGWEFQQLGGGIVWKFYPGEPRPRAETAGQHILELPVVSNIVGRFLRITSYGETEQLNEVKGQVAQDEARQRLTEQSAVHDAIRTYGALPAGDRTPGKRWQLARDIAERVYADEPRAERAKRTSLIVKKLSLGVVRGTADPLADAVLSATSTSQKLAVLETAGTTMGDDAFRTWLTQALREQVISPDLYAAARRGKRPAAAAP